jgi:CopA family copper-resistance protein
MGLDAAIDRRRMWNQMRMIPTDFSDVAAISGRGFAYLMNGLTADENFTATFRPGERVRLRFINGSATTIYDVRIPGLKLTVVQADGQDIEPVTVDEFRISVAETYDVLVEPDGDRAYTIFAQSIGRTGYVRGTLTPRPHLSADVPAMDRAEWLTAIDMMGAMSHGPPQNAEQREPAQHGTAHGEHSGSAEVPRPTPPRRPVRHARTEYHPNVDMRMETPRTNLDDPGPNLRSNGRRVLTYADLRTVGGALDMRGPQREIELHLTGHMERFVWSFDGLRFSDATPIRLRYGERVRVVLSNDTMMTHPIHLHGMWSELETPDEQFLVRKHTVSVQPAQRVSFRVTADALGRWAFHCHLLYHMEAGMFREFAVTP